ncbi:hypothetical protein STEG23_032457, partial [Scotinomys teguina]
NIPSIILSLSSIPLVLSAGNTLDDSNHNGGLSDLLCILQEKGRVQRHGSHGLKDEALRTHRNHMETDDCYFAKSRTSKLPIPRKGLLPKGIPKNTLLLERKPFAGFMLGDVECPRVETLPPKLYTA